MLAGSQWCLKALLGQHVCPFPPITGFHGKGTEIYEPRGAQDVPHRCLSPEDCLCFLSLDLVHTVEVQCC